MIQIDGDSSNVTVHLAGKLTSASVFNVNAGIQTMLRDYGIPENIVVDITEVIYMNASVLQALYYLARFMRIKGKVCSVQGRSGIVNDFIHLAGMEQICSISDE